VQGGGQWRHKAAGVAVLAAKPWARQSSGGRGPKAVGAVGRRCSDRVTDQWVPHDFTFFQNLSKPAQIYKIEMDDLSYSKNSKNFNDPRLEYFEQLSKLC
jgi:hypothetical protein